MTMSAFGWVRGCALAIAAGSLLLHSLVSQGARASEKPGDSSQVLQLQPGKPLTDTLPPGTSRGYSIEANAGDLVHGMADSQMAQGFSGAIVTSSGERLRQFTGGLIAFVAPKRDRYEVRLTNAGDAPAAFQMSISVVRPLSTEAAGAQNLLSPKLQQRSRELAAGDTDDAAFWSSVASLGTPLVEQVDGEILVTLLWRGTERTREVKALWSLFHLAPVIDLQRLGRSDIWFRSFKFAPGTRFEYTFAENPPAVAGPPMMQAMALMAAAQADPLHVDSRGLARAELFASRSRVEVPPTLTRSPWTQPREGVKRGKVETFEVDQRRIGVYTPAGYARECGPYPLLLLLDGSAYQTLIPVPVILDNLIAAGRIAPTIAVFVDNRSVVSRSADMYPNASFTQLIAGKVMTEVRSKFAISRDPQHAVIGGFSLGGLAATHIAWRHPEMFGGVLSQSGAFWWSQQAIEAGRGEPILTEGPQLDPRVESFELAHLIARAPKAPIRLHLSAGLYEGDLLVANRFLRDVLTAKGNEVEYHEFPGGHDGAFWRESFADAFLTLASAPLPTSKSCGARSSALHPDAESLP